MENNKDKSLKKNKNQGGDEAEVAEFDESVEQNLASTPSVQAADAKPTTSGHSEGAQKEGQDVAAATSSSLQQLEQDVASKQQSRPMTAATTPGAVSVSGVERELKGKQQGGRASQPGAVAVSASTSLDQLERDINAKQAGAAGRNTLQALEQDIATKRQMGGNAAARPGAVAVSASTSLEQVERDLSAKQAAGAGGRNTLQALEQDVATKRQMGGKTAARPGAVAVSASTSLEQLERDLNAKQAGGGRNSLQALEQDVASKRQAGGKAARPGAVAVSASTSLEQLERDLGAKQAGGSGGRNTLQALEQDVASKRQAGGNAGARPGVVAVSTSTSLEQLEQDLVRKQVTGGDSRRQGSSFEQVMLGQNQLSNKAVQENGASSMMTDLLTKTQLGTAQSALSTNRHGEFGTSIKDAPHQGFDSHMAGSTLTAENHWKPETSFGDYAAEPDHCGVDIPPLPLMEDVSGPTIRIGAPEPARIEPDPEQPAIANPGVPFFAETVVDATGVAVISGKDEVNEEWERRSIKRLVCYGAVVLVIAVVAAVVPAVLLSNKGNDEAIATDPPTPAPTFSPTAESFPLLLERLTAVTDIKVLHDHESMQHKAAKWIASEDYGLREESESKLLQRYILAVFYFAMRGDSWGQCNSVTTCYKDEKSWLSATDECDWAAVGCNADGIIEELNFDMAEDDYDVGFYGPDTVFTLDARLPDEIGKLSDLKLFHLYEKYTTSGNLSVFADLTKLESLYLERNSFTGGIAELAVEKHPNLRLLNVANNDMKGSLPSSLAQLNNLTSLVLRGNHLSGQIPSEIGLAPKLEILDLQNNNFTGTFPETLYNGIMQELRLEGNQVEGSLASDISLMTNLRVLNLGSTSMSGEIQTGIFRLPLLSELDLSNSNFGGELSEDFRYLNATLMDLSLDGNNFSGKIPGAFDELTILELLALENNPLLTGSVSAALCNKRGTGYGRLEELSVDCVIECGCCGDRQCP